MKIILINKYHYLKGGAERAYFDLASVLEAHGHEVAFFSMENKNNLPTKWSKYFVSEVDYNGKNSIKRKILAIINLWYNFEAKKKITQLIKDFQPDIAHLHGIYHQLSPSIIDALHANSVPMVMTLHDYKLISPVYNLFLRGQIWEKSKKIKFYKCFFDKGVKNSYLKSLVCTIEAYFHYFSSVYLKVNIFISPSRFLISKFREYDFKGEMVCLPNPLFLPQDVQTFNLEEKYVLYYGRLSSEKGLEDLLLAWKKINTDYKLKIIGRGPDEEKLKKIKRNLQINNVEFLGHRHDGELWALVKGAEFAVLQSACYENAPYTVLEAMSLGQLVLAPKIGGYSELIRDGETGFLYKFADVADLENKIRFLLEHPELKNKITPLAIDFARKRGDKDFFYQNLIEIYGLAGKKIKHKLP